MVAMVEAVKKWRHYLVCRPFTIITDHQSLRDLVTQRVQTPEQQRYLKNLLGYDFTIVYQPGKNNTVADALLRKECVSEDDNTSHTAELNLLYAPIFSVLQKIRETRGSYFDYRQL